MDFQGATYKTKETHGVACSFTCVIFASFNDTFDLIWIDKLKRLFTRLSSMFDLSIVICNYNHKASLDIPIYLNVTMYRLTCCF